jgi:hypothetical protein
MGEQEEAEWILEKLIARLAEELKGDGGDGDEDGDGDGDEDEDE